MYRQEIYTVLQSKFSQAKQQIKKFTAQRMK